MQETTKWLLTVFAALGSVLLAGLRFSDLGRLTPWSRPFAAALLSGGAALGAVGVILWKASQLLASHYASLRQVLEEEATTDKQDAHGRLPAHVTSELIRAIEGESNFLYRGVATDRRHLFEQLLEATDELVIVRQDSSNEDQEQQTPQRLSERLRATLKTILPTGESHEDVLVKRIAELNEAADRVVDFADYWVNAQRL
jgi:hypothetical protein